MSAPPTLVANRLSFSYREGRLFSDVSFSAYAGEILGIVGVSGSGKSTLLSCLCGVIPRLIGGNISGEIIIDGIPTHSLTLPQLSTKVGIVFQNPETQLFLPTVEDEVAFGVENLCLPPAELARRIDDALEVTGMLACRTCSPATLSGGQKQLVVLAAVLAMEPALLLLDEVLAQVDAGGRLRILNTLTQLAAGGKTILMIDHDPENLKICTRLLQLENGRLCPVDSSGGGNGT